MDNCDPLVPFGIAVTIIVGLFILVPFVRRKSDLPTAWNILLLGIITFVGLASIETKYVPQISYEQLHWFQPSASEVTWYMQANTAFIVTLILAYYFNAPAKRFAQKRLRKWPEAGASVTLFILGYCLAILMIAAVLRKSTFLGPVSGNLALIAAPAASLFSFQLWYRNRLNILWLALFVVAFSGAAIYSMIAFAGRRLLMSVFLGPLLYFYWAQARNWSRTKIAISMTLAGACILTVISVYSQFRHFSSKGRTASSVVEQLRKVRTKGDYLGHFLRDPLQYLAQDTAHFALLTQRYVDQGVLHAKPLNTIRFLIAFPVPRKIWAGKPALLGAVITRDAAGLAAANNWGCGIAGQGAYEGGIPALMIYAVLVAFGVRFLDEPLQLQPSNPFLIFILASAAPHLLAIPRGDMGVMTMQVGECVLTAIILGYICRAIFGVRQLPWQSQSPAKYLHAS